jgi:ParB family chromosome partitioning protein
MAAKKTGQNKGLGKGLGKGLDSLIPIMDLEEGEEKVSEKKESSPVMMDIHKIEPNREQPRKIFEEESLNELADSIRQYGVLQPLLVQKKEDYYAIIAGERRWRAARLAGLKEVPVWIRECSRQEGLEIALIENIQRQDLNPVEEARAYQMLVDEFGLKHEELADRVSKSRASITNSMRLLKLDEVVLNMVEYGELTQGHARALLALPEGEAQKKAAQIIVEKNLSVRETESLVKTMLEPKAEKKEQLPGKTVYRDIEKKLKDHLGTKVSIRRKDENQGKIEISYYSVDELERILEMIQK